MRFSSQTYNLRKLHESIHLTNNSVQCRYKNCNRDPGLPQYNMWDRKQFEDYLENVGFPDVFEKKIYPGMKQNIIAAILLNQDFITPRRNCFELYGADFMLTEDFQPWLIEINSRPALYASTPVTTRMCREVLEDVVKGLFRKNQNRSSSFILLFFYSRNRFRAESRVENRKFRGYLQGEKNPSASGRFRFPETGRTSDFDRIFRAR